MTAFRQPLPAAARVLASRTRVPWIPSLLPVRREQMRAVPANRNHVLPPGFLRAVIGQRGET